MAITSVGTPIEVVGNPSPSSVTVGAGAQPNNIWLLTVASNSSSLTASTVSGGGVVAWNRIGTPQYSPSPGVMLEIWMGVIVTGGPSPTAINVAYSGSTAGVRTDLVAMQFGSTSALYNWTTGTPVIVNGSGSANMALPNLAPTGSYASAYYGYVYAQHTAVPGTSPNFSYNVDGDGCLEVWNTNVTEAVQPTFGMSPSGTYAAIGLLFQDSPTVVPLTDGNLCHVNLPAVDATGQLYASAIVRLLDSATQVPPVGVNFFSQGVNGDPLTFPVTFRPGIIDLWSDAPIRVDIIAALPSGGITVYKGVDFNPPSYNIMSAPAPMAITFLDQSHQSVLVSGAYGQAAFQVIAPTAIHQHGGDSPNSVVLTDETPTDYDPQQTWIGYHAGENSAYDTTGTTAVGFNARPAGAQSTVVGQSTVSGTGDTSISSQTSTLVGDYITAIGAFNVTNAAANELTVIGSDNITNNVSPNNTVVGSNNTIKATDSTYLGDAHTVDTQTGNHTLIGHANQIYPLPVSQVPLPSGYTMGSSSVTANNGSGTDWFGGGAWAPVGYNEEVSNAQGGMIPNNVVTNLMTQVLGNAAIGSQSTTAASTGTVGFYGGTAQTRTLLSNYATDTTSSPIPAFISLVQALHSLGIIRDGVDPVVSINMSQALGTPLEYATTGQSCQWSVPFGSTGYQATNPFKFTGSSLALVNNTNIQNFGVFSTGQSDWTVTAGINFDSTATSSQKSGILIRSKLALSGGLAAIDGLLVSQNGVYQVTNGIVGSSLSSYGVLPNNCTIKIVATGTSISVYDTTSGSTLKTSFTSSYNQTNVKVGFMLSKASAITSFSVM